MGTRSNVNKQTTPDSYAESKARNMEKMHENLLTTFLLFVTCVSTPYIFIILLPIFRTF